MEKRWFLDVDGQTERFYGAAAYIETLDQLRFNLGVRCREVIALVRILHHVEEATILRAR
jgi:hypothetical protein